MNSLQQAEWHAPPAGRAWLAAAGIAVLLHGLALALWLWQGHDAGALHRSAEVEMTLAAPLAAHAPRAAAARPQPLPAVELPAREQPQQVLPEPGPVAQTAEPTPAGAQAGAAQGEAEPDYRAAYLNNPPPVYPMAARRRGMQGRVVLNIEVLADGLCGQVLVQQSSGYAMLDEAALQTVKHWRFEPARRQGQAVAKWFFVPIAFSLKDETT